MLKKLIGLNPGMGFCGEGVPRMEGGGGVGSEMLIVSRHNIGIRLGTNPPRNQQKVPPKISASGNNQKI